MAIGEEQHLTKTVGVILPGHGNPMVMKMIEALRTISIGLAKHSWRLDRNGDKSLIHFSIKGKISFYNKQTID